MLVRLPSVLFLLDFAHRVLKRIVVKAESSGLPLFICSVDILSALDSLIQAQELAKLLECGVKAYVVASLKYVYHNSFVRIKLNGETLS